MKDQLEIKTVTDRNLWTELLSRCHYADIMQTWEYGDAINECIEWQPVRQVIYYHDKVLALAQLLLKEVPVFGKIARIQHGPLFVQQDEKLQPVLLIEAIKKLKEYWTEREKMRLHLTPGLFPGDLPDGWNKEVGLRKSNEVLWSSIRIDLQQSEEQLRKKMKRQWRNALKKAENSGLKLVDSRREEDFKFFIEKYHQATIEKGFTWPSPELTAALWESASEKMRLLFAEMDGEAVAAMVTFGFASTGIGFVAWNSARSAELHAHRFLIWHGIKYYKNASGYHWFDLGGIDPANLPGISAFKRATGGEEYSLIGNYEAIPEGAREQLEQVYVRQNMSHFIPGLELPEESDQKEISDDNNGVFEKVKSLISTFVKETLNIDVELDADLSLIDGGIIDSLSLVSVVQALQDTFDIQIYPEDITIENFDKITAISALVEAKKQQR